MASSVICHALWYIPCLILVCRATFSFLFHMRHVWEYFLKPAQGGGNFYFLVFILNHHILSVGVTSWVHCNQNLLSSINCWAVNSCSWNRQDKDPWTVLGKTCLKVGLHSQSTIKGMSKLRLLLSRIKVGHIVPIYTDYHSILLECDLWCCTSKNHKHRCFLYMYILFILSTFNGINNFVEIYTSF